jgi:hypothetical protein
MNGRQIFNVHLLQKCNIIIRNSFFHLFVIKLLIKRFPFVVELLFEALIGQKSEIRFSYWSKSGQTGTQTEEPSNPNL